MPCHKDQQNLSGGKLLLASDNSGLGYMIKRNGRRVCLWFVYYASHTVFIFLLHVLTLCHVSVESVYRLIDTDLSQSLVYLCIKFTYTLISSTGRLLCRSYVCNHSYWEFMCTTALKTQKTVFYGPLHLPALISQNILEKNKNKTPRKSTIAN